MDNQELQELQSEKNIHLILNDQNDDDSIDLGQVFHNMKSKSRIYAWVLILCLVVGLCVPLLLYQFTKDPLTVFSAVTLQYQVDNDEKVLEADPDAPARVPVSDLTAPDGEALDLSQITSSYVLQNALNGLELSQPITLSNLRSNITVTRILTEESARQQEVLNTMLENKSSDAYQQMANAEFTYSNTFTVSLANGFGEEDSRVKLELKEDELRLLLDRILIEYNNYLVKTYADQQLPEDVISVIDLSDQDILDSVDQIRSAVRSLYSYCEAKPEEVRSYRSWRTGYTLNDLMDKLQTIQEVDIEYLYTYVYANGIARDRDNVIDGIRYKILVAQTELQQIEDNIAAGKVLLEKYKNDEILVSVPENDSLQTAQANTAYYNDLILKQAEYEESAASKREELAELNNQLQALNQAGAEASGRQLEEAEEELAQVITVCDGIYQEIRAHMEEVFSSAFYTIYAEHSASLGKSLNFLEASAKKIVIGIVLGGIIGLVIWFIAGLAPEFARRREAESDQTDLKNDKEQEVDA